MNIDMHRRWIVGDEGGGVNLVLNTLVGTVSTISARWNFVPLTFVPDEFRVRIEYGFRIEVV